MTYKEAVETLGNRPSRKVANNTYLQRRDETTIALRYHETDVLVFTPKYVEYQTGGWFTVTTKDRMNRFAPAQIGSDRGKWLLYLRSNVDCYCVKESHPGLSFGRSEKRVSDDAPDGFGYWPENPPCHSCQGSLKVNRPDWESGGYIYFDGIRVSNDGRKVLKPEVVAEFSDNEAMNKKISDFVKLAMSELDKGMPLPSGGDCWYCALRTDSGETMGDLGDSDHLLSHMAEGYVVPSLLWNAVKEHGYSYPEIILGAHAIDSGANSPQVWVMGGSRAISDSVARALRKYLKRRLVPNQTA